MRPGLAGALALLALLALLASAGPAGGAGLQDAPRVEADVPPAPLLRPGTEATVSLGLRYCYASRPATPATIEIDAAPTEPWLSGSVEPRSFRAETGGQTCGSRSVAVLLRASRAAPAFEPASLRLLVEARATGGSDTTEVHVPAQADYWAEVRAEPPPLVRAERGGQATVQLRVAVAGNDATRLEVTGFDPERKLTIQGVLVSTATGHGLDDVDERTVPLTVTVSPGAPLGVGRIQINLTTFALKRPGTAGEATSVQAQVEVGEPAAVPGPGAAFLALAAAGAALASRRLRAR